MPKLARLLIDAFWPGPVTVIVTRAPGFAAAAAGGQDTIGLRAPAHPIARALLEQCAALGIAGLAAPSANRFGGVSPTSAAHVVDEFGTDMPVLDGGDCEVGIESCIVDCTRGVPVLLRPGRIARAQLEAALGQRLHERNAAAPRAPGNMAVHYAPKAKVRLMDSAQLKQALGVLPEGTAGLAVYSRTVPVRRRAVASRTMPDDPGAAAHELFRALREFDARGVRLIWIETPPDTPEWEGVTDRLLRAAAA
jgi:L-threonylcarbamoyladenylate synthase